MNRLRLVLGLVVLTACAAPAANPGSPPPKTASRSTTGGGTAAEAPERTGAAGSLAVFDRMVALVRRYHLFAPRTAQNLGKSWDADLPRLRAEFAAAEDDHALAVALFHFGNSLHDIHCGFRPKGRGERIKLGLRLEAEKVGDTYQLYVDRVRDASLRGQIAPGDIVVAVDGVPGPKLFEDHDLDSNANTRDNLALAVANVLTSRRTGLSSLRAGMTSTFTLRSRRGGDERTIPLTWSAGANDDDDDFALDYASKGCVDADPKDYGAGYALTTRGYRLCIYTSKEPKYRDYPIVRQVSFRYDDVQHGPLADYELLARTLASPEPKGVLLDVQDNGGGINPNLFVEWWSAKPYTDTETRMLLDESLLPRARGSVHISSLNDAVEAWYAAELASQPEPASGAGPGERPRRISKPRPFMCKRDTCAWDNHYVPSHRVTKAPVALLLGPGCASACDAFAWHFDVEDTGPIVGRGAMAGFTTHRARFDVPSRDGKGVLGTIDLAIAYDTPPGRTESIEAVPVTIDVPIPRTFENHEHYDRLLVDGAIRALTSRK